MTPWHEEQKNKPFQHHYRMWDRIVVVRRNHSKVKIKLTCRIFNMNLKKYSKKGKTKSSDQCASCWSDFGFFSSNVPEYNLLFARQRTYKCNLCDIVHYSWPAGVPLGYLWHAGRFVPVAGDEDGKRPVIWVHDHSSCLSAGGVERRGAAAVGTLDTAAIHLPLHPFPAECTLLQAWMWCSGQEEKLRVAGWSKGSTGEGKETSQVGRMRGRKIKQVIKGSTRQADPDTNWNTYVQKDITQLPFDYLRGFWHHKVLI